jgi:hypothetical protein
VFVDGLATLDFRLDILKQADEEPLNRMREGVLFLHFILVVGCTMANDLRNEVQKNKWTGMGVTARLTESNQLLSNEHVSVPGCFDQFSL